MHEFFCIVVFVFAAGVTYHIRGAAMLNDLVRWQTAIALVLFVLAWVGIGRYFTDATRLHIRSVGRLRILSAVFLSIVMFPAFAGSPTFGLLNGKPVSARSSALFGIFCLIVLLACVSF